MTGPTIGSLFTGYGGLEQAVLDVLGGTVAWHSEHEPPSKSNPRPTQAAARLLAHHYPGVPNLGDISAVDWSQVEPVDVLTGGFPCQGLSLAGLRLGLLDARSGLWERMAHAIDQLRPSLVVIENVRGLLSAEAGGSLESCPWCVGDPDHVPLRALGAVLGDLADLGYDARWVGLRAADVGAPHGRFRVFITAWPAADAERSGRDGGAGAFRTRGRAEPPHCGGLAADSGDDGRARSQQLDQRPAGGIEAPQRDDADGCSHAATDAEGHGRDEGWPEPARLVRGPDDAFSRDADAHSSGRCGSDEPISGDAARLDVGPVAGAGRGDRAGATSQGVQLVGGATAELAWGPYGDAIRRWERLTRPAPSPTEPGSKGQPRLSPAFVEWMMGLPAGHVTAVPGLTRNEQLKMLGNGVVPQQAAAALRVLLADPR